MGASILPSFLLKLSKIKIIRYAFIGLISTAIHLSVAYTYLYYVNDSIFISNVIGFLSAYLFSYTIQSKYVFKHAISLKKALKYFIVQFSSLMVAIGISYIAIMYNSYIKTLGVAFLLPLITFIVHKFWTFSEKNISDTRHKG